MTYRWSIPRCVANGNVIEIDVATQVQTQPDGTAETLGIDTLILPGTYSPADVREACNDVAGIRKALHESQRLGILTSQSLADEVNGFDGEV